MGGELRRPDLQNKLFPIIHDRRVQGRALERLRYRWAAMNPPPDADAADAVPGGAADYLGAEPLAPALVAAVLGRIAGALYVPGRPVRLGDELAGRRFLLPRSEFPGK